MSTENMRKLMTLAEGLNESFTRKHFQMVADTLQKIEDPEIRRAQAEEYAQQFAMANPRFRRDLFMKAAGVLEEAGYADDEYCETCVGWDEDDQRVCPDCFGTNSKPFSALEEGPGDDVDYDWENELQGILDARIAGNHAGDYRLIQRIDNFIFNTSNEIWDIIEKDNKRLAALKKLAEVIGTGEPTMDDLYTYMGEDQPASAIMDESQDEENDKWEERECDSCRGAGCGACDDHGYVDQEVEEGYRRLGGEDWVERPLRTLGSKTLARKLVPGLGKREADERQEDNWFTSRMFSAAELEDPDWEMDDEQRLEYERAKRQGRRYNRIKRGETPFRKSGWELDEDDGDVPSRRASDEELLAKVAEKIDGAITSINMGLQGRDQSVKSFAIQTRRALKELKALIESGSKPIALHGKLRLAFTKAEELADLSYDYDDVLWDLQDADNLLYLHLNGRPVAIDEASCPCGKDGCECGPDCDCEPVEEEISLDSIVESVLGERGQPKDYELSGDELATEIEDETSEFERDSIDPEIEDEELGLRFD